MDSTAILTALGFTEKEVSVYLATLELGMAPVSIIARKASLKRPTAHEVLKKLCSRGYAERFLKNKIRYYAVLAPDALCDRYREYVAQLQVAVPALMAIHNRPSAKPRITFYEGKDDLQRLYLDVLTADGEILNYFLPEKPYEYFGRAFVDTEHIAARIKKGIALRAIMPQSTVTAEYIARGKNELREIRMITDPALTFTNEVYIYGNKMSIFSFDEGFALLVESEDVVRTQKVLFELAWRSELVREP